MSTENETVNTAPAQGGSEGLSTPNNKKAPKAVVWVVVAVVVVILGAFVAYQKGMLGFGGAPTDTAGVADPSAVVATVNGVNITRGELDEKAKQIRMTMPEGAAEADPTFESRVLDEIINLQLLLTRSGERGIAVGDEKIDAEIKTLVELFGSQEAFDVQLTAANLTMEELRKNMKNELMIRALVDADTNIEDVTVTDEELKGAYDVAFPDAAQSTSTPSLEQVGEMLRTQLVRQKSDSIIKAYIDDVRKTASIETFLQ